MGRRIAGVILLLIMPSSQPSQQEPDQEPDASTTPLRRRRWPRLLFYSSVWVVSALVVLAGVFVIWLRGAARDALPQLDGDVHLSTQGMQGLSSPVMVRRDEHGV